MAIASVACLFGGLCITPAEAPSCSGRWTLPLRRNFSQVEEGHSKWKRKHCSKQSTFSTSCFRSRRPRSHKLCSTIEASASIREAYGEFITEVAKMEVPPMLPELLDILEAQGGDLLDPSDTKGILPLAIPLSRDGQSGQLIALLRWPTPPEGMEMPVIQVEAKGVTLLAKNVSEYINRLLLAEDTSDADHANLVFSIAEKSGQDLYKRGNYAMSKLPSIDVYLMQKVGYFPEVLERLALRHLERGDTVSALVTGEFYVGAAQKAFPGFGRPFVFNAELFVKAGRLLEAKDAARMALKSPWWTLGAPYEEVAALAGWGDEKLEYVRERFSEEARMEDLNKGKSPEQVSLDQAAYLLDCAAVDGSWDEIRDQLVQFYKQAGLGDLAAFVTAGGAVSQRLDRPSVSR